jgi:hypothetical protein
MRNRRTILGLGLFLALLAGAPSARAVRTAPVLDAGLFISKMETDAPDSATRFRSAGPVVERIHKPSGRAFCALRPVAAEVRDAAQGTSTLHVLWPLFTSNRRGAERSWNSALILWGRDADIHNPTSQWSLLAFPLVATGRTKEGSRYGGLFPIWGRLEEFAGMDRVDFAFFPLYAYTRQGDLNTWNILFPVISWTRAPDEARFRVFPLYGQAREPGIRRRFILWPIWNEAQYSAPQHVGYSHMLFPLYGRVNLDNQQSWMVLPPFFRYTEAGEKRQLMAPWPFVQLTWGGDDEKTYLWPFWGVHHRPDFENGFVLWPLGGYETDGRRELVRSRRWLVPFYFDERALRRLPDAKPVVEERRVRVWPLATYQRDATSLRFHTLELWPAAPVPAVERLYAPFWTLYSHERVGTRVSDELLWGLFRRNKENGSVHSSIFPLVSWGGSTDNDTTRWDLLKGFLGYERQGEDRKFRMLYFMRFD